MRDTSTSHCACTAFNDYIRTRTSTVYIDTVDYSLHDASAKYLERSEIYEYNKLITSTLIVYTAILVLAFD